MSHLIHIHTGFGAGLEKSDSVLPSQLEGGHGKKSWINGSSQVVRHPTSSWPSQASSRTLPRLALTLSACSFCTFLLASMSHLFPRRRRSTPAEAFWEQKGKTSKAGSCSSSQCPSCSRFCPHLFDALHPVLNILKGFLICDVVYQDDALGMAEFTEELGTLVPFGLPIAL